MGMLGICAVGLEPANAAHLPTIEVSDHAPRSLVTPTREQAAQDLQRVPGGASIVDAQSYRDGPTSNLQDVFEFAPGVFAQNRFGGDEVRISIRGSGISQDFAVKGLRYLRNGLPISEADGDFHSQLIEPLTAQYIEIYRGANALEYGASSLGGAINFVTHTGYSAEPLRLHLEGGSDGYIRPQISGGDVLAGGWDYYGSFSGSYLDGFRDHAETQSSRGYGNLGYRWNEDNETRLHLDAQASNQELPGSLTRAALRQDPTRASGFFKGFNAQNNFRRYRAELQHAVNLRAHDQARIGLFYETQDIDHPLPFGIFVEDQDNYGANLRHVINGQLAGRANRLTWGALVALGDVELRDFQREPDGRPRVLRQTESSDVLTGELFIENYWQASQRLGLIAGAQLGYAQRETDFSDPNGAAIANINESYFGFSPKLGATWQATAQMQLFGNVSRSYEPPILLEFNNALDPATGTVNPALVLDDQQAITVEIGARGARGNRLNWDVAVYYSWVKDELLTVEIQSGSNNFATDNADDTVHAGVEIGAGGEQPLAWFTETDRLRWRAALTYNDFHFDDDSNFNNNEIPGIPNVFGNLELLYQHPAGFYIGPTLQYASDYFVDFANTLQAERYALIGAKAGYADPRGRYTLFLEARNLENDAYASNTSTLADAQGADQAVFNPGQERAFFAGIDVLVF